MTHAAIFTDPDVAELEPVFNVLGSLKGQDIDAAIYDRVEIESTDRSFKTGADFAKEGKFDGFIYLYWRQLWESLITPTARKSWPVLR